MTVTKAGAAAYAQATQRSVKPRTFHNEPELRDLLVQILWGHAIFFKSVISVSAPRPSSPGGEYPTLAVAKADTPKAGTPAMAVQGVGVAVSKGGTVFAVGQRQRVFTPGGEFEQGVGPLRLRA